MKSRKNFPTVFSGLRSRGYVKPFPRFYGRFDTRKDSLLHMKFPVREAWDYYRGLRWNNLKSPKYRHLFLILYWPFYGLCFLTLERFMPSIWLWATGEELIYTPIACALDYQIPLCEWFVIPYYYWFVYLIGTGLYFVLFDIRAFREFSWLVILTYSSTIVLYLLFPNCQELRPAAEEITRDNWMVDVIKYLYDFDTNTNVCPSIHVLGSLAVFFPGMHSRTLKGFWWKFYFAVSCFLICISTVFMRQHSILDVLAALAVGVVSYIVVYLWICPLGKEPERIGNIVGP